MKKDRTAETMVSVQEYADLHGVSVTTMYHRLARGRHPEAIKISGTMWIIPKDAPFVDGRRSKKKPTK